MKCPLCGADIGGKDECSKCGTRIEGLLRRIEVEYKDFKVSEFLEIRRKDIRQSHEEMADAAHEVRTAGRQILERPEEKGNKRTAGYSPGARNPFPFIFILIAFLLAIVAGVFFLVRFLVR